MLRFNVEARTWTPIGKLQHGRDSHGIAEANLNALCQPVGNLNPAIKRHQHHQYHYHQGPVSNLIQSKHCHRQNVTSHHSFSLIGGTSSFTGEIVKGIKVFTNWKSTACNDFLQVGRGSLFKMAAGAHALFHSTPASSQLGVMVTVSGMGRWTGVQIIIVTIIILFLSQVRL